MPAAYPDSLDGQLLLSLAQMQFDYSDPATVAPYVLKAPLPGVPAKQLVMQMGVDDAQVPNVVTEMIARTSGIPLLSPAATSVTGMTPTTGPLSSALTTWDVHGTPAPPDTNQTPPADNQVHEAIRRIPQVEQQNRDVLRDGEGRGYVRRAAVRGAGAGVDAGGGGAVSAGRRIPPAATCPQPHPPRPPAPTLYRW